jgi:hypothetical protein
VKGNLDEAVKRSTASVRSAAPSGKVKAVTILYISFRLKPIRFIQARGLV